MHKQKKDNVGAVFVRLRGPIFDLLEDWRRSQIVIPSRSEAVRSFIERALPASGDPNVLPDGRLSRARNRFSTIESPMSRRVR